MRFRRSLTFLLCALLVLAQTGAALHALSHLAQVRTTATAPERADHDDPAHRAPMGTFACDLDSAFGVVTAGAAAGAAAQLETASGAATASAAARPATRSLWLARDPRGPPPNLA